MSLLNGTLLEVIFHSDVETIKCLRLTCRAFRDLIDAYRVSITSNVLLKKYTAEVVKHFTSPNPSHRGIKCLFEVDRRIQFARVIAADEVDTYVRNIKPTMRTHEHDPSNYIVSVPNMLRYLIHGTGILWRFSDLARQIIQRELGLDSDPVNSTVSQLTRDHPSYEQLDEKVLQAQIQLLDDLSVDDFECFFFALEYYFVRIKQDPSFAKMRSSWSDDRFPTLLPGYCYPERDAWIRWYMLREGPDSVVTPGNTVHSVPCAERVGEEWKKRQTGQLAVEGDSAMALYCAARERKPGLKYEMAVGPVKPAVICSWEEADVLADWSRDDVVIAEHSQEAWGVGVGLVGVYVEGTVTELGRF